MTILGRILIVEDDPNDVELTLTALTWQMRSWLPATDNKLWTTSTAGGNSTCAPPTIPLSCCSI